MQANPLSPENPGLNGKPFKLFVDASTESVAAFVRLSQKGRIPGCPAEASVAFKLAGLVRAVSLLMLDLPEDHRHAYLGLLLVAADSRTRIGTLELLPK